MPADGAGSEKVTLISVDSHVGPPFDALRPYCPKQYLDDFDAYAKSWEFSINVDPVKFFAPKYLETLATRAFNPLMHYDPLDRIKYMDEDGIAAEVVYHGAVNGTAIPFLLGSGGTGGISSGKPETAREVELGNEGFRIYHRWLVDYCAAAPERRLGLIHLPWWDIQACADLIREGAAAGLKGVNLPAPRHGMIGYNNLAWDPVWDVCEELDVPMSSHAGFALVDDDQLAGENAGHLTSHEILYMSRRTIFFMILGGVFHRHPKLRFVLCEQPGGWVYPALKEMDGTAYGPLNPDPDYAPKMPSEFFHANCWIGASFMSRADVASALNDGMEKRIMWGADFPHPEGTYPFSVMSLRYALEGVDDEEFIRDVVGRTAAAAYGFDMDALQKVADRIGPTMEELRTPLDAIPEAAGSAGFRLGEAWS